MNNRTDVKLMIKRREDGVYDIYLNDTWVDIFEELEKKFPCTAARVDIRAIFNMLLNSIAKSEEGWDLEDYIRDVAAIIAENFINYLEDMEELYRCYISCF